MKAEDLKLHELVSFQDGCIDLHGRRLVLHSINAIGQFRRDLIEMLGVERARRAFTRFGYFWGQADASALSRVLDWDDPLELIRASARLHGLGGIVRPEIRSLEADLEAGRFHMEVVWHDSGEAEEHLTEMGWADYPVCWKLVGYATGAATKCLERDIYFVEEQCRAKGDDVCVAVGKDRESWGEALEPHLKYFEFEDIKGKVGKLTEELTKKAQELARQRQQQEGLQKPPSSFFVTTRSKAMEEIRSLADRVARFDSPVLITGDTGVGKEVLARHIHTVSPQSKGPFLAVNCGALPETLLESELFGHKKGAFTGAVQDRIGLFEQAGRGVMFLDEIGDITPAMQLKLLRVLQEKEIMRVGESRPRRIDARVLAATNRDLDQCVADGTFREDLLYRLRVIEIQIPPLRDRPEDILPLARLLVERLSERLNLADLRLDATVVDHLLAYSWPGNVRELENSLERAAILSRDGAIIPENLPRQVRGTALSCWHGQGPKDKSLAQVEMEYIEAVLRATDGNRTRAAEILGISPTTLWRRLKEQGITP